MTTVEEVYWADRAERPSLMVMNGNWGATSLRTIGEVIGSAKDALVEAFGVPPDDAIRVSPWRLVPRTFYDCRPYEIRLTARDSYWSQYIYQFSHELCHVLTGFDRYREHRHKWFEETLCELASLFTLYQLSETWATNPPSSRSDYARFFREFAPNHATYAEDLGAQTDQPSGEQRPAWFADKIETMQANSKERKLNRVVAVALLKPFRNKPALWRACSLLNHWNPQEDATFADYLDSWQTCLQARGLADETPCLIRELFQPAFRSERASG